MEGQPMILVVALAAIIGPVAGTVYTECQLATILQNQDFTKSLVPDWVCLIMSESSGNTAAKGGPNSNGSYDYGLFQINSKYWCGLNGPAGDCNIACSDLLDDDITDDIACAKIIYKVHGFSAWYGWQNKCSGKTLAAISPCDVGQASAGC